MAEISIGEKTGNGICNNEVDLLNLLHNDSKVSNIRYMLWNLNKYSCLAIIIFIGMNAFAYDNSVYFENKDLLGGDVVIKKLFNEDSDSNTIVSFEVESKDD